MGRLIEAGKENEWETVGVVGERIVRGTNK